MPSVPGILWVPRPLRLEVVYLHIIVGNVAATVSAMTVKFLVHRNAGLLLIAIYSSSLYVVILLWIAS